MTFTGLLLAGGLSRRMGRDKATLVLEGRQLWARQLDLLGQLNPHSVFISARALPPWAPRDVQVVLDRPPSRGPLSGIAAALHTMATSHLLVLAVDLPFMTSSHLRKLAGLAGPACGIIPWNEDHFEPLAAIYPKEAELSARRALSSGDWSLQSFVRELLNSELMREYELPTQQSALYQNINTLGDLGISSF